METKAGAILPDDRRPERSPCDIELTRARRRNGVLPAAMVGGDLSLLLPLR